MHPVLAVWLQSSLRKQVVNVSEARFGGKPSQCAVRPRLNSFK
jgi:hypothetical protein